MIGKKKHDLPTDSMDVHCFAYETWEGRSHDDRAKLGEAPRLLCVGFLRGTLSLFYDMFSSHTSTVISG